MLIQFTIQYHLMTYKTFSDSILSYVGALEKEQQRPLKQRGQLDIVINQSNQ